ncbi:MAG TPA: TIGR03013 family XrtA/PEP-CTERM system glycosyltransferase [Vicinamibacterales bacterium]|jgi:sugar transferase (PEP-CTERM system associated)|nr:TIGR03013 family XrtA/PEP-CTERM system glycosyltransferase [Vicinamibacterales bacterium]
MQVFNRNVSVRGLTVFGFEVVLISGSMALAAQLHGAFTAGSAIVWQIATVTALCQLCFYYNDLYDLTVVHSNRELVIRLLQAAGAAAIVLAAAGAAVPGLILDPSTFLTALGVFMVAVLTWRVAFNYFAHDPHLEERILIVGTGQIARTLAQQIGTQQDFAYRLVGFVEETDDTPIVRQHDILGTASQIDRIVAERRVDRIVVGLSDRRGHLPIEQLLRAKISGVRVEDATTTYERLTGKILIDDLKPSWLIFSDGFRASRATRFVKRMLDLSFSVLGVVLSAPLMILTAIAIRLDSAGPVLYSQPRVGENGRVFRVYKFRSMRTDAERGGTPVWASDGDDRVTRVGRFIRTTRLDELPQFWNVMRGDMSFVGPRPERPFFVDQLAREIPFYLQRHAVKPGLTGWAQVKYQYGSSVEDATEKLRYDLYYIKHLSIFFDLTIVLDTVKVILFGKGAK